MSKIGLAADHGGFDLKNEIARRLEAAGHTVVDFGPVERRDTDDYPDFVIPFAQALARGEVDRGIAVCGSGVGACIAANKVSGVRAGSIIDVFSAHQGVEDDDINLMCMGGRVVGVALAWELIQTFLYAEFSGLDRHKRRIAKVRALER